MPENRSDRTAAVLRAGSLYFALIFAAGFALGTLRVLVLAPAFGALVAVLLELPVMLGLSWIAARRLAAGLTGPGARLAMGGWAFALLMVAEFALATLGFGQGTGSYLAAFATLPGALGLAGQACFALIPWLQGTGRQDRQQ